MANKKQPHPILASGKSQLEQPLTIEEASRALGQSVRATYNDLEAGLLSRQYSGRKKREYKIPLEQVVNLINLRTERRQNYDAVKELAENLSQAQQEKLLAWLERELQRGHEAVLRAS